jgi:hypothetical protein
MDDQNAFTPDELERIDEGIRRARSAISRAARHVHDNRLAYHCGAELNDAIRRLTELRDLALSVNERYRETVVNPQLRREAEAELRRKEIAASPEYQAKIAAYLNEDPLT